MTLTEAIYKVITTRFKKDMGEAKKIVRGAGYIIEKDYCNNGFSVYNPTTGRRVSARLRYGEVTITRDYGYQNKRYKIGECKFDFVSFLNKPRNTEYREMCNISKRPTKEKYRRLSDAKYSITWRKRDIENTKKEIAKLQESLLTASRYLYESEARANNVRRELGLRTRN